MWPPGFWVHLRDSPSVLGVGPVALGARHLPRRQRKPVHPVDQGLIDGVGDARAGERAIDGVGDTLRNFLTLRDAAPLSHFLLLRPVDDEVWRLVAGRAAQREDPQVRAVSAA